MKDWNRIWIRLAAGTFPVALVIGVLAGVRGSPDLFFDFVVGMLACWLLVVGTIYGIGWFAMRWATNAAHVLLGTLVFSTIWLAALAIDGSARMMLRNLASMGADLPGPTLLALTAVRSGIHWLMAVGASVLLGYVLRNAESKVVVVSAGIAIGIAVGLVLAAFSLVVLPSMHCSFEWPSLALGPGPSGGGQQELAIGNCGGAL